MQRRLLSRTTVVGGVAIAAGATSVSEAEERPSDPIDLFATAITEALADTGSPAVGSEIDVLAVVGGLWQHSDPARIVAERLGLKVSHTARTHFGGHVPIALTADLVARIGRGEIDVALVVGGECTATRYARRRIGQTPPTPVRSNSQPDEVWGMPFSMGDEAAVAIGADQPRRCYAVLDSAIRTRRGSGIRAALERDATIAAGFARVAQGVLHAADRRGLDANAIATPTKDNRMVSWPFTKAMCANNVIDRAGAFVLCSSDGAARYGINTDRCVVMRNHVLGADTPELPDRKSVGYAPGLTAAAHALLDLNGPITADTMLDLYCCFPSMVDLTTEALGIAIDRPLTVSGGLGFTGAPINFAAGEGLIAMVERLREKPGAVGVVQANGGVASSHAFLTMSTDPGADQPVVLDTCDRSLTSPASATPSGRPAMIDGITVDFNRWGPNMALALVATGENTRKWAMSTDPDIMHAAMEVELVGSEVSLHGDKFALWPHHP